MPEDKTRAAPQAPQHETFQSSANRDERQDASDLNAKSVRELQDLVEQAAPGRDPARPFSRDAELHLIDELSRKGANGLGVVAGFALFAAVLYGGALPTRAAVWMIMVFAALYAAEKLRRDFRAGDDSAARPFRWRADYTASLAVLSAGFGAGAFLLAPAAPAALTYALPGAPGPFIPLLALGLAIAAMNHTAHLASAVAMLAPGFAFILPSAVRAFGLAPSLGLVLLIAAAGAAAAIIIAGRRANAAMQRFPRTRRRLVEDAIAPKPADPSTETGDLASGMA